MKSAGVIVRVPSFFWWELEGDDTSFVDDPCIANVEAGEEEDDTLLVDRGAESQLQSTSPKNNTHFSADLTLFSAADDAFLTNITNRTSLHRCTTITSSHSTSTESRSIDQSTRRIIVRSNGSCRSSFGSAFTV